MLSCDQATIQGVSPNNTTIISATPVTAPVTYCDVRGSIATTSSGQNNTVLFALGLPNDWRGDFVFIGNGGFAGSIQAVNEGEYVPSIADGLATAATDTGHESPFGPALGSLDGSFGLSGGQPALAAREDFAYRAVHLSTVSSEAITGAYYNSPMYSYFDGCSTGGRQALVEAEKFPTDFNGILAGDPAIGNPIAGYNWNDQALLKYSQAYLSPADITTIDQAVLAECDGLDGKVDGLIQDPRKCNFNPIETAMQGRHADRLSESAPGADSADHLCRSWNQWPCGGARWTRQCVVVSRLYGERSGWPGRLGRMDYRLPRAAIQCRRSVGSGPDSRWK